MSNLDRLIRSEYSTDTVAEVICGVEDNYSNMLEKYVPKDKLNDLEENINEYIERVCGAVFQQGFIRGIAAAKGGVTD